MLFLHVFHPTFHARDWRTENIAVVLATASRRAGIRFVRANGIFHKDLRLVHQVVPITEGMILEADGHDHACLAVNGNTPPEA